MSENKTLTAALWFIEHGYSVIPISPKSKVPPKGFKVEEFRKRLATPEEVKQWFATDPDYNLAMITGELSGACVVDLDSHKPNYDPAIAFDYFSDHDGPVSVTPRLGNHLYYKFPAGLKLTINAGALPGIDFRGEGGYILVPPSRNGTGNPYAWVEDKALGDRPLSELPEQYANVLRRGATPTNSHSREHDSINSIYNTTTNTNSLYRGNVDCPQEDTSTSVQRVHKCLHEGMRNEDIFSISNAIAKGGLNFDMAKEVIEILANNAVPPYPVKEAFESLKSAYLRKENRERNIHAEIREYILDQKCLHEVSILTTACLQSLQLSTRLEKRAAYQALARLCDVEKLIEKQGDKRGEYRILGTEKDGTEMDLLTDLDEPEVPVELPIGLSKLCVISPGNICVVAGSKSAGKTTFLMTVAWANQHNFEVVYLNSEMHPKEFRKRMKAFAPLPMWNIKAHKCNNNYEDFIDGGAKKIYIIDYLEIHDNFYEIAKPIRKIHEKLGDAICFIGLQMKVGGTIGRGGDFSAEKARLYLTLDHNREERRTKMMIYDAKEPRYPYDNVRGMGVYAKITAGSIIPFADWAWI